MKILLVANFFPYPPNHGTAVDIWGQILSLTHLGHTIDLVATDSVPPDEAGMAVVGAKIRNFWFVHRSRNWKQALALQPFQVVSRNGLRDVPIGDEYDVVLLQTDYVADILRNPRLRARHRILRVHNNEVRYYADLSKTIDGAAKKLLFLAESVRFRSYSRRLRSQCDQLWFISDYERQEYVDANPQAGKKAFFLPTEVEISSMRPYSGMGTYVLFVGALTRAMNMRGLEWYIRHVHPELSRLESYRFMIVGYTGNESIEWLHALCRGFENISIRADVEELGPIYEGAAVFVNPIFAGAGLKLKTIRAAEAGLPIVTTKIGAEGTGLRNQEHLLIADSPEEFAKSVAAVLSDNALGQRLVSASQSCLMKTYDQEACMAAAFAQL